MWIWRTVCFDGNIFRQGRLFFYTLFQWYKLHDSEITHMESKRWIITRSRLPGNLKYSGSHVLPVLLFRYLWSLYIFLFQLEHTLRKENKEKKYFLTPFALHWNIQTARKAFIYGLFRNLVRYSNSTKTNAFCLGIILCNVSRSFDYLIYPYYPAYTS